MTRRDRHSREAKSVQAHHPDPRAGSEESRHLAFAQLAFVCVCVKMEGI